VIHTATAEQIRKGLVTDVYFERTREVLKARGIDKEVRAEFMAKRLPLNWPWAVFAGWEECAALLADLPVDVKVLKEGTLIHPYEPVLEIRGKYLDFGRFETAILGLLCQASGVATMAARCRKAAGEHMLMSFGARRMHPAIAPMLERNAYVGGCDAVALVLGAELIGQKPFGTMPHALILLMGDTVEATKAFDEVVSPEIQRVSLIDTFNDEKFEAIRVAEAMGGKLYGVRLDTPASRRGDFLRIIEEVRWELDLRGHRDVKIVLSGGLDEHEIPRYHAVADAYAVGTAISSAPVVDFSMDIVEIDGAPVAKRGKMSGAKAVFRCGDCFESKVLPLGAKPPEKCGCGGKFEEILLPLSAEGKKEKRTATEIRGYVLKQLEKVRLEF
jgi:nicotinate phosphoribosyltransferase